MAAPDIRAFVGAQLDRWPLARANFEALRTVRTRSLDINGLRVQVQFNPSRAISSKAKTDPKSISERPCFLCRGNRPALQDITVWESATGASYDFAINPFPIFPDHMVICSSGHVLQQMTGRYADMLELVRLYPAHTFFYNGPACGASAPDHFHFQCIPSFLMPVENDVRACFDARDGAVLEPVASLPGAALYRYRRFLDSILVICGKSAEDVLLLFDRLLACAEIPDGECEPRFNMVSFRTSDAFCSIVIFRTVHRSSHYYSTNPSEHLSMAPGCADMGGVFITVEPADFDKLTEELLSELLAEITPASAVIDNMLTPLREKLL